MARELTVPEIVRGIMKATGLKQAALAKKVKVSQGTVSKWLSPGGHNPNKTQWDRVEEKFASDPQTSHLFAPLFAQVPLLSWVSAGRLADASVPVPLSDVPLLAFADLGRGEFFALKVEGDFWAAPLCPPTDRAAVLQT